MDKTDTCQIEKTSILVANPIVYYVLGPMRLSVQFRFYVCVLTASKMPKQI